MLPGLALIPIGVSFAIPAMPTAILSSVERRWASMASAVLNAARQGGATGVVTFGAIVAGGTEAEVMNDARNVMLISAALLLVAVASVYWSRVGAPALITARPSAICLTELH